MIKNKKTGQIYIGQSKNIEKRFVNHCSISPIDIAIANEGVENFDFIILEELSEDKLLEREKYWIDYYNTYDNNNHYNQSYGCNLEQRRIYTLWDVSCCHYQKDKNYTKCFNYRYHGYRLPIGMFHDFVSCQIINQLIEEAIKNEIK